MFEIPFNLIITDDRTNNQAEVAIYEEVSFNEKI